MILVIIRLCAVGSVPLVFAHIENIFSHVNFYLQMRVAIFYKMQVVKWNSNAHYKNHFDVPEQDHCLL